MVSMKQLSLHVNNGYSDRLNRKAMDASLAGDALEAYRTGYRSADQDEIKAGRGTLLTEAMLKPELDRMVKMILPHYAAGGMVRLSFDSHGNFGEPELVANVDITQFTRWSDDGTHVIQGQSMEAELVYSQEPSPVEQMKALMGQTARDLRDHGQAERLDAMTGRAGGATSP